MAAGKPLTALLFVLYMGLFICMGQLVQLSKRDDGTLPYNPVLMVFLADSLKLVFSSSVLTIQSGGSVPRAASDVAAATRLAPLYMVPAGLYAVYNVLTYENMKMLDATTYFLLLQGRVVVTAVVARVLLGKRLSTAQWLCLVVLTFGCILSQMDLKRESLSDTAAGAGGLMSWAPRLHHLLLLVQILCSCFAGVYTELLLKGKEEDGRGGAKKRAAAAPLMVQNIFMYLDSIVVNLAVMAAQGSLSTVLTSDNLSQLLQQPLAVAILLTQLGIGIVVSLFLKYLNSILKVFASALEICFTAVLSWIILGQPITAQMALAIILVCGSIVAYSQSPPLRNSVTKDSAASGVTGKKT